MKGGRARRQSKKGGRSAGAMQGKSARKRGRTSSGGRREAINRKRTMKKPRAEMRKEVGPNEESKKLKRTETRGAVPKGKAHKKPPLRTRSKGEEQGSQGNEEARVNRKKSKKECRKVRKEGGEVRVTRKGN